MNVFEIAITRNRYILVHITIIVTFQLQAQCLAKGAKCQSDGSLGTCCSNKCFQFEGLSFGECE